jgi:hypothetical protein
VLAPPQAGGPPLVGCPRLLIQYIPSYPPYLKAVPSIRNLRTRHAVVTRDPPNMVAIYNKTCVQFVITVRTCVWLRLSGMRRVERWSCSSFKENAAIVIFRFEVFGMDEVGGPYIDLAAGGKLEFPWLDETEEWGTIKLGFTMFIETAEKRPYYAEYSGKPSHILNSSRENPSTRTIHRLRDNVYIRICWVTTTQHMSLKYNTSCFQDIF